jgi:putative membrane protein
MRLAILSASALALAGCGGTADESGRAAGNVAGNGARPAPAAPGAEQYVAFASAGDLFEIASARLALDKAESAEVRGLAQMILADHERLTRQLAAAAGEVRPPLAPATALDPAQQAGLEALGRHAGPAFDQAWLREQVRVHEQALDLAAAYARLGESMPLRRHAAATIAPVQTHLIRARRLEAEALAEQARIANSSQEPSR